MNEWKGIYIFMFIFLSNVISNIIFKKKFIKLDFVIFKIKYYFINCFIVI